MPFAALHRLLVLAVLLLAAVAARAQTLPRTQEGEWTARDFRFHTGQVLPEVKLRYTTVGDPKNEAVLVLHGTGGSARSMLTPAFAGELFGPGQPLDASKYFIVLPDALGHGGSAKPSDGLRAAFPRYNYDDMVDAQVRLVREGLGIRKLRMVIGNSMGGMHAWIWATRYPDMMDIAVPMACQPTAMSSRNWIMRRLIVDSITNDPEWNGGNYSRQPRSAAVASIFYAFGTNGGNLALAKAAPTRAAADALLDARLKAPFTADANDTLYHWASSGDYDPSPNLEKVTATVLAINSADDERNPPETGLLERAMQRVKGGRILLIPASEQTAGHGTTANAKWYAKELGEVLRTAPRR